MATAIDPKLMLSQADLETRRRAVECVLGSLRMEGLEVSPELSSLLDRFQLGEISLQDVHSVFPVVQ